MSKEKEIIRLTNQGFSQRSICKMLKTFDRKIRQVLSQMADLNISYDDVVCMDDELFLKQFLVQKEIQISQIAKIYNVTPSAVSIWRKELLGNGRTIKMRNPSESDKEREQLVQEKAELEAKVKSLEHDVYQFQLERDVLEKAGDILKKRRASILMYLPIEKRDS